MNSRLFKIRFIPFYLIGSYLVIAPFLSLRELGMYDSKRLLQVLLLTTLGIYFLYTSFRKERKQERIKLSKNATIMVALIFVLGLISSALSEFPRYAFIEIVQYLILMICVLELSKHTLKAHYRLGKCIFGITIIFSSVYLIYFLGNYIAAYFNPLVPMWPDRLAVALKIGDTIHSGKEVLNFANRRFFNHLQTWTFPIIVSSALWFKSTGVFKNLILGLLLGWWILLFASGARGTMLSLMLASIVLLVIFRKRSYRFLSTIAGTSVVGYLTYYVMFKMFMPSKTLPVARIGDSARLEKWAKAWELWLSSPVLGVGPMHYAATESTTKYSAHPHNFYLQLLAEWGVFVLFCFLALLIFYLLFFKKEFIRSNFEFAKLSNHNSIIYMGFIGSVIAGFSHAGISGVFHTPMSQIWAILINSWFISLWNRKSDIASTFLLNKKYLSATFLLFIIGFFFLIIPDYKKLNKTHTQYKEHFNEAKVYPRFWEQGLIYEREEGTMETGERENGSKTQDQNQNGQD